MVGTLIWITRFAARVGVRPDHFHAARLIRFR
jgi:hypothetical protein